MSRYGFYMYINVYKLFQPPPLEVVDLMFRSFGLVEGVVVACVWFSMLILCESTREQNETRLLHVVFCSRCFTALSN